ncbi:MAG: TetR/AcrR family transcriptional regulator [Bacteroidota bacterium]
MKYHDTKQHIIETASTLFYKNGYNLTGINQIIAEAGIAKATLYAHFKSKEEICLAYLNYKNSTFLNDIENYCQTKPFGAKRAVAIFDFLQEFFEDRDFNGCWCIKTAAEVPKEKKKIKSAIQNHKQKFIEFIFRMLDENVETESEEELDMLVKQAYLLYEGAVAESHLHQEDWPIRTAKQLFEKILY